MLTPFGEWVRAFRERERITLREMARTMETSPSFLSALELGRKSVPPTLVDEIDGKYQLSESEKTDLRRSVMTSRTQTKVRFDNRMGANQREVAMLFARNFDKLTDEETEKIRIILEERDDKSQR
jgi:HTH-type transcriptional regulator, competence development regulator